MTDLLRVAAGVALWLAAGRGLLRLTGAARLPFGALARPCAWLLAGVAAGGALTSTLAVLGLPVRAWPLTGPLLAVVALAGGWPTLPRRRVGGFPRAAAARELPALVAMLLAVPVLVTASVQRITTNDEYAIWGLKARLLDTVGHLQPYLWSGDPSYDYSHRDYPILVPSIPLWGYSWLGRENERLAHLLVALVTAAGLVVAVALVRELSGVPAAAVTAVTLGGVQGLALQSTWVMADTVTMVYALCLVASLGLVCLSDTPRVVRAATGLAGICAGAAAIAKNEGAAFTLAALLVAAAVARRGVRRRLLPVAAAALVTLLPWSIWARAHGLHSDVIGADTLRPSALTGHLSRLGPLLRAIDRFWPGPSGLALAAVVVAAFVAVLRVPASRRTVGYLALAWLMTAGVLTVTYLIGPFANEGYWASNLSRVFLLPAVLAWTLGAVAGGFLVSAGTRPHAEPDPPVTASEPAARSAGART